VFFSLSLVYDDGNNPDIIVDIWIMAVTSKRVLHRLIATEIGHYFRRYGKAKVISRLRPGESYDPHLLQIEVEDYTGVSVEDLLEELRREQECTRIRFPPF